MHEWALAESVIKSVREHSAAGKSAIVSEVGIVLGELQAIDREIFMFALAELVKTSFKEFKNCEFKIINEPASFKCGVCSKEFDLKMLKKTDEEAENIHFIPEMAHAFLRCPKCKSPDFAVTAGRGVSIKYIKDAQ